MINLKAKQVRLHTEWDWEDMNMWLEKHPETTILDIRTLPWTDDDGTTIVSYIAIYQIDE